MKAYNGARGVEGISLRIATANQNQQAPQWQPRWLPRRGFSNPSWLVAASALFALAACDRNSHSRTIINNSTDPGPNPSRLVDASDPLPGILLTITEVTGETGADGTFRAGDFVTVLYTATTNDGVTLDVAELDDGSIYISGPTFNYQRVIAEQSDLRSASVYQGDGVWSYRFSVPIPASYLPPLNDTTDFTDGELTGQALLAGTYTVGMQFDASYVDSNDREYTDAGNAVENFLLGGAGTVTPRQVVQSDNCNVCHTELRAHDSTRKDVRLCVLCHTAGAEDSNLGGATPGVTMELKVMIHRIHNGSHLPSVLGVSTDALGNRVYPGAAGAISPIPLELADAEGELRDFSGVGFPVWPNLNIAMPKDADYSTLSGTDPDGTGPLLSARACEDRIRTGVTACAKCHGDPDADGPLTAPAQGEVAYTQPTRRACGACHDDVDWTKPYVSNGLSMVEQANDSNCVECHANNASNQTSASLKPLSVTEAHLHPLLDPVIDAGVNSVITAVTGGTLPSGNFQTGDTPTVTFTLKNDADSDLGLSTMDSCSAFFFGPTTNQQLVMPYTSPNGMSLNPFDFAGRLQAASTTNKGTMSKVLLGDTTVAETLVVEFTSATAFTVTGVIQSGTGSGSLGTGALPTLPAANSTNPAGSSVSAIQLGSSLGTGTVQITFTSPTHFEVSGAVTGAGDLPASTSASTRFTSADLSFNISVGSAAFAATNTINLGLFRGSAANPVLFAIVAGRTAFSAGDRFYYEVVPSASTYTVKISMDLALEFLADSTAAPLQALPAPGNTPVYYGRQVLWEAALTATTATTTTAATALGRQVDVSAVTGFANGDTVAIEPATGLGVREYVQVAPARADGVIAAAGDTTTRLHFKTPLRYNHSAGVTITKVTLTFKQEGSSNAYTLDPATGVITSTGAFTADTALVLSYRTESQFGYSRHSGDSIQAVYVPPANDSTDIGQEQGDWQGLPYQDGTYTVDVWFYKNIDLGLENELQTYRSTSNAGTADFLFGGVTEIVPHEIISTSANCYTCHNDVIFHGGGRRGLDACLTCHSLSGNEDKPRWDTPKVGTSTTNTALTTGVAIEFRQMLHKIHRGSGLANAATYTVVGNQGNPSTFEEINFPAMPGGVRQCVRCHGNDAWKAPAARTHELADVPVKTWTTVCSACHDSDLAEIHFAINTSSGGDESCAVCHDVGREFAVEKMHLPR